MPQFQNCGTDVKVALYSNQDDLDLMAIPVVIDHPNLFEAQRSLKIAA